MRRKNHDPLLADIKGWHNVLTHIIIGGFCLLCVFPFIFITVISFTDDLYIANNGYTLFPEELSLSAYRHIAEAGGQLFHSYGVTAVVTAAGTILTLLTVASYAYAISRRDFRFRRFFSFFCFFTMLFNGGMVPTYIIMTQFLHLRNTIWALILPLMVNAWYILILRTYFSMTVPQALIEAGRIDGAGEFRTFFQIVIPISLPGLATIGLFSSLGYWNDWFQALLYITDPDLTPLQYLMIRIENNMEFLISNAASLGGGEGYRILKDLPRNSTRMAMVVLCTGPVILFYPFFQKFFIRGLTVGSMKG